MDTPELKVHSVSITGRRRFIFFFWFVSWHAISLGISIDLFGPNLEVHLPFGFIKLGWTDERPSKDCFNYEGVKHRLHGWD
jgi:hypothetical protein